MLLACFSPFAMGSFTPAGDKSVPEGFCLSSEEMKLYELINRYRKERNLPPIPLSKSLSYVSRLHVIDLSENPPTGNCNMHSWSKDERWTSCCYTPDHRKSDCMWNKPRELTNYPGNGYEIAHGSPSASYIASAEESLAGWKSSSGHNQVIINKGTWASVKWKAVGVGIYKNYAVVWFGEQEDPETGLTTCK